MFFILLLVAVFFAAPLVALYNHSKVSYYHSACVAANSWKLSRVCGKGFIYSGYAYLNGLYHDVGKILVPAEILHCEGRLTNEEFAIVKSHASNWIARLYGVFFPACIGHHKDFAGTGYGAEKVQSQVSSIVEICDVQNAIKGYFRTYRELTPDNVVIDELINCQSKFDGEIAMYFFIFYEEFEISERLQMIDIKMREEREAKKA